MFDASSEIDLAGDSSSLRLLEALMIRGNIKTKKCFSEKKCNTKNLQIH
jgi:hypothetical protein